MIVVDILELIAWGALVVVMLGGLVWLAINKERIDEAVKRRKRK